MLQIKKCKFECWKYRIAVQHQLDFRAREKSMVYWGQTEPVKTTLFKSMLGLTAFSGEILSDGQPVSSRYFGSLIEYPAFLPRLTVEENLKLHAQYLGLKRPNIEVALKQVNLLDARKSCSLNFLWGCANDWELPRAFFRRCSIFTAGRTYQRSDPMGIKETGCF